MESLNVFLLIGTGLMFVGLLFVSIAAKGYSEPVAAYRPLKHRAMSGKERGIAGLESPLVGRDHELASLEIRLARERVKELFGADHANVQPHCGSAANMAVYRLLPAAGVDPGRIVYAGVGKTDREINQAIDASIGWFNIESEAELARNTPMPAKSAPLPQRPIRQRSVIFSCRPGICCGMLAV